jgi:hypothetical protein
VKAECQEREICPGQKFLSQTRLARNEIWWQTEKNGPLYLTASDTRMTRFESNALAAWLSRHRICLMDGRPGFESHQVEGFFKET